MEQNYVTVTGIAKCVIARAVPSDIPCDLTKQTNKRCIMPLNDLFNFAYDVYYISNFLKNFFVLSSAVYV